MPSRSFSCAAALACVALGLVAGEKANADAPLKQTINGVTVTITGFGWGGSPGEDSRCVRNLGIQYTITADPSVQIPSGKGPADLITDSAARDVDGEKFYNSGGRNRYSQTTGSVVFGDVVPSWPYIDIDLDFADPSHGPEVFTFRIPVSSMPPAPKWNRSPVQTAIGPDVQIIWEYTEPLGKDSQFATAHFLLRDRHDPSAKWDIESVTGTNDTQAPINGRVYLYSTAMPNAFQLDKIWQVDGSPILDGDITRSVDLGGQADPTRDPKFANFPPSKSVNLTITAEAIQQVLHRIDFANLPIPAPGQAATVNKTIADKEGDWLEVCKIVAYDPAHPLPDTVEQPAKGNWIPASGVAVMLAEPLDPDHPGRRFSYFPYFCSDSTGVNIVTDLGLPFVQADPMQLMDPSLIGTHPRKRTFLIPLKDPAATQFDLKLERSETIKLPKEEDVTFTNVAMPQP